MLVPCLVSRSGSTRGLWIGWRVGVVLASRGASLKCGAALADKMGMIRDLLDQGLPVALMVAFLASLWIAGIWILVKDERGPAVLFTRLLLVGFAVFVAWRFAVPVLR